MKNKIKILAAALLTTLITNVAPIYAATASIFQPEAFGMDTIAGFEAPIYSSKTVSNKTVQFTITKPNGNKLNIPVLSNNDGIAEFNLYDYHTKIAGEYKVSAKLENAPDGTESTFTVFPDNMSSTNSSLEPNKLIATADGKDQIYLTVKLKDKYNNAIKGHEVSVISSRSEDTVERISEKTYTDENGSIIFGLSSVAKGVSVYSIIDMTATKVLDQRIEVAYSSNNKVGGDILKAYAAAGEVSYLEFENIPSNIQANSDVNFTLSAYDSENDFVPNYTGTIHFSVDSSNSVYANLPNDYTFDIDFDSGSHTFQGAGSSFNFSQPGTYTIVATDLNDFTVRGETDIIVGTSSQGTVTTTTGSADLVISSPTSGTYGNNQITISGKAPSTNLSIQLFDNEITLGTVNVEVDQSFTFQASDLVDGNHTLLAVALDSEGTIQFTSDEVTFTIDTSAPVVEDIKVDPAKNIKPGDILNITITSEPTVFQGAVVFNVDIAELEQDKDDQTKYHASIQAPFEPGVYPLDVILVDELGNEGSYTDVITLEISESGAASLGDENGFDEPEDKLPTDVFGVKATSGDGKVSLNWQNASDDNSIDHYRIYFGISPANLTNVVDTLDNKNTWYIPSLENGKEYFFSVVAVDSAGQESYNLSSIVSGIPFTQTPIFAPPVEEPHAIITETPKMESTGPEVLWFFVASLLISQLYFKFKKKMC